MTTGWRQFRLCGTDYFRRLDCHGTTSEELLDDLIDEFPLEEGSEVSVHFHDEDCTAARPLDELLGVQSLVPRGIELHIRRPTPERLPWTATLNFQIEINGYDPFIWREKAISVGPGEQLENLVHRVQTQVSRKLRRQRRSVRRTVRLHNRGGGDIPLPVPAMRLNFRDRSAFRSERKHWPHRLGPDDYYLNRVARFRDLFQDPKDVVQNLSSLTVHITATRLDDTHHNDIVERVRPPPTRPVHVRIGDAGDKLQQSDDDIALEYALMARLDGSKQNLENKLYELPGWDFGDFCIGDPLRAYEVPFGVSTYQLHRPFRDATSHRKLKSLIPQDDYPETRVPSLPSISFITKRSPQLEGIQNSDDEAIVAVELISHLTDDAVKDLYLDNCQLQVKSHESAEDVADEIIKVMENGDAGVLKPAFRKALFEGELKSAWERELWVLPQNSKDFVLHPFGKKNAAFSDFLDWKLFEGGDRKIYMECHILPKGQATLQGL